MVVSHSWLGLLVRIVWLVWLVWFIMVSVVGMVGVVGVVGVVKRECCRGCLCGVGLGYAR